MKLIVTSLTKNILVTLCLLQVSVSYAVDQEKAKGSGTEEVKSIQTETNYIGSCKFNSIFRTKSLIDFMLKDILLNYDHIGGGGITSIKELRTNTYEVSIAQEERDDVLTYELAIDDGCVVTLLKKTISAVSFGE